MVSFENFVKLVSLSLSELKVTPSFCFAFKIPEDVSASIIHATMIKIITDFGIFRNLTSYFFATHEAIHRSVCGT